MFEGQSVLVTGGTGSFGQAFCRAVLTRHQPRRLIILSRDEFKQAQMEEKFNDSRLRFFLGDVRDRDRLMRAFNDVHVVVHCAALKRIESGEYNPAEVVKTNIVGAQNVLDACIDRGVEKVIGLSTDKAVNPVNLYGASKLCAEKLFTAGNSYAGGKKTRFSVVRDGNVKASRGSVIEIWREQAKTGELTITHPQMTRFWLSLEQAVEFVLVALREMKGAEVFVPKIPSVRMVDVAKAIAPDARLRVTGVRLGEKMHELLVSPDESWNAVDCGDYYVISPTPEKVQGTPVGEGFKYSSDSNSEWLSVGDIRRELGEK